MADAHREAKEAYEDAKEESREQHARMREDLLFSNPSDPQQWDKLAIDARKGRPCLTFDRTNQFIMQVVNDARRNKPSIKVLPADSKAQIEVAEKLNGIIKHIEYISRAGTAYDTAIESAARVGLGWIRVVPKIMRPETNEQEVRIMRVHDPLSVLLEAGWTEPDGSDARKGWAETMMGEGDFKRAYPKAKMDSWDDDGGWFPEGMVRVCEYFNVKETRKNNIITTDGATFEEDEYHAVSQQIGFAPPVHDTFWSTQRSVKWSKLNGCETLEETDFPSQYIPLVPVMGYELWIDGKRYLCGMTRRLMDGQRAYNYERSAFIESVAMQPKAPFMVAFEALEGHEEAWGKLNGGNPTHLPFNAWDDDNRQLPQPIRLNPPALPVAFAQGGQIASQDMESAVGMFKANLGQQGNETSGKAIRARQQEGDTANFHYIDNQARAIEQVGRIVVDMIPRIYDTKRQARIISEDGAHSFIETNPDLPQAVQKEGKKTVAINLGIGAYDVRVDVGPSYTTVREETAQNIVDLSQGNPQLAAAMAPMLFKLREMPEAEKMSRVAMALLPPPVQKAYEDDEGEDIPPQVQAQIQQLQQQIEQMGQMLQEAQQAANDTQAKVHIAKMQATVDMKKIDADVRIAEMSHAVKAQGEQMKGEQAAMGQGTQQQTALAVAQLNAENRIDVASIAALTQLELAAMQPTPELQGEMNEGD